MRPDARRCWDSIVPRRCAEGNPRRRLDGVGSEDGGSAHQAASAELLASYSHGGTSRWPSAGARGCGRPPRTRRSPLWLAGVHLPGTAESLGDSLADRLEVLEPVARSPPLRQATALQGTSLQPSETPVSLVPASPSPDARMGQRCARVFRDWAEGRVGLPSPERRSHAVRRTAPRGSSAGPQTPHVQTA